MERFALVGPKLINQKISLSLSIKAGRPTKCTIDDRAENIDYLHYNQTRSFVAVQNTFLEMFTNQRISGHSEEQGSRN